MNNVKRFIKNFIGVVIIAAIIGFYFFVRTLNGIDRKDKYYVNSLYLSNQNIYNNYLDKDQKDIYDLFIKLYKERTKNYETTFNDMHCKGSSSKCIDDVHTAFDALIVDHPEMISVASYSGKFDEKNENIKMSLYYATPFKIVDYYGEAYIDVVIEKIKEETKDMTDAEKIVYVYNWIGKRAEYDYAFMYSSKDQSAFNAIVKRNAVCAGFAKTASIIFQRIGINAYAITGHNHMWNVVEYEGKYYYFDSTTAACTKKDHISYYNGLTQTEMNDYGVDHPDWYPYIEEEDFPFIEKVKEEHGKK